MTDEELRARLRAADPAASLPTADPTRVARMLGEIMDDDLLTESRETGTHDRSPLTWLVAAAAAAVIAGVGTFVLLNGDGGTDTVPSAGAETSVTELRAPDLQAYSSRCMVPNARVLADKPVAFDGTVEDIGDGLVTLTPTHWYAGDETDVVTVEDTTGRLGELLVAVEFEEGGRYLVAASDDGEVMICGFSAPYDDDLAAIYAEAFEG